MSLVIVSLAGAAAFGLVRPFFSAQKSPDSPVPPSSAWRGLLIQAPAEAVLDAGHPMILVHGTYRIQGRDYPRDDRLVLKAVDAATGKVYEAEAGDRDPSPQAPPPPPPPEPDPAVLARMVYSGHFSADLVATLGLPRVEARYRVSAALGSIVSNEVLLRVVVREKP